MQRNLHQQELQRMHLNVYTVIVHVLYTADDRTKRWNIYYYITGRLYQDISGVVGGGGRPPLNKFRGCSGACPGGEGPRGPGPPPRN